MEQQIKFCTTRDGVRIAYATVGEGPPLVKAANWLSHLEYDWGSPIWRHLLAEAARDHTFIRYDERGNGLSDWDVPEISFGAFVEDLESVVEAAGVDCLREVRWRLPAELEQIINKALQKERSERYQTVKELRAELRHLKQELNFRERLNSGNLNPSQPGRQ